MKKYKYYFFFRGSLDSHVELYLSWLNNSKIKIQAITALDRNYVVKNIANVTKYQNKNVKIIKYKKYFKNLTLIKYFLKQIIENDKVVIHIKKQNILIFKLLKIIFKDRIDLKVEIEGDPWAELDYLSKKENKLHEHDYENEIRSLKTLIKNIKSDLHYFSVIYVVTDELKKTLIKNVEINEKKIIVKPTGYNSNDFYFDDKLREKKRKELNIKENQKIYIYTGNCYYSWQNLNKTIKVFKNETKNEFNSKLILLIRKKDHHIANTIIQNSKLEENRFILTSVDNEKVNEYLNAADVGILIRDNHQLNKASAPGKIGEYLGAGLFVITTAYIGLYSKKMIEKNIGYIYYNFVFDKSISNVYTNKKRKSVSNWSKNEFSSDNFKKNYIQGMIQDIK